MVIRDAVPEVQFRYEEADRRIVLRVRHVRRNDSVMHSYTLTLTLSRCLSPTSCSLPSLVKGSEKQSSYGEYRGKELSVSNENFKFKIRKHPCVIYTEGSGTVWMCLCLL